jgi:gamma-glutamylputrescine oxidase
MSFLSAERDLTRHSYCAATVQRPWPWASLAGALECDVAALGGGLAGLSAAVQLADRGARDAS